MSWSHCAFGLAGPYSSSPPLTRCSYRVMATLTPLPHLYRRIVRHRFLSDSYFQDPAKGSRRRLRHYAWFVITPSGARCSNAYLTHSIGLHLIIFLARYLDELTNPRFTSWYELVVKVYLIHAASAVLIAYAYAHVRDNLPTRKSIANELKSNFFSSAKKFAIYLIPAALLAYRFHYGQHSYLYEPFSTPTSSFEPTTRTEGLEHVFGWFKSAIEFFSPADLFLMNRGELIEVAWAFSIYLSAIADVPQYMAYYHYLGTRTSIDWYLMTNMFLTAMFRVFYIPHWIIRYVTLLEPPYSPLTPVSIQLHPGRRL